MQGLTWDDLRILLALRRTGSFSAAAQQLRVNQTTVARRIDALEEAVGTRLVERSPNGCSLTEAGLFAAQVAESMEAQTAVLEQRVAGRDRQMDGTVRITTAEGFVPTLSAVLLELRASHPNLHFELLTATTTLNLVQREADLAIRMTPDSQPSLISRRLGTIPWAVYGSEAYLRRKGDCPLEAHDVIGFVDPLSRTPGGQWLSREAAGCTVTLSVNNVVSALSAASEGLGLVAAPSYMAKRLPGLRLALPGTIGASEMYAVAHQQLIQVPRVRVTIEALVSFLRRTPSAQG
jgi:DNA-binding transcriptional LysR family regulator